MMLKNQSASALLGNALLLILLLGLFHAGLGIRPEQPAASFHGIVIDGQNGKPIEGATVKVRALDGTTLTDRFGRFAIGDLPPGGGYAVTAWKDGYYIAWAAADAPADNLLLGLRAYHTSDNPDYPWVDPRVEPRSPDACGNCHPAIIDQWLHNAHGRSTANDRFYSIYNGVNASTGERAEPALRLDLPDSFGSCAACHAPGAAIDDPFNTDMNLIPPLQTAELDCDYCHEPYVIDHILRQGEITDGIHCDFCHKIAGLRPETGYQTPKPGERLVQQITLDGMPGVAAFRVLRPPPGERIFVGPYVDIFDPDTHHPIFSESEFCAPCHQLSLGSTLIYNSYGEWLASPFAANGITCQDCHMAPTGDEFFALESWGGRRHDPASIPSHRQLGLGNSEFMRDAILLEASSERSKDQLHVEVAITNLGAGHHYPTDHPGRHLLLQVEAVDAEGQPLPLLEGPRIPAWGGDLSGAPGELYGKILEDQESGAYPVVSYWKPTMIRSDNRIPALASVSSRYAFAAPQGAAEIRVRLLLRRLYQPLADEFGWGQNEILLSTLQLGAE